MGFQFIPDDQLRMQHRIGELSVAVANQLISNRLLLQ
jgi:hypothetical protein